MQLKVKIKNHLKQMASSPKAQIKRLAIGTGISILAMLMIFFTSYLEYQWLFYLFAVISSLGIIYAIPGYIGVWVWRMKDVIFRDDDTHSPN